MAKASEIKKLAEKLKIPYNNSWNDDDILASIADRVGVGYDYSESAKNNLLSTLKDLNGEQFDEIIENEEIPETLEDYGESYEQLEDYQSEEQKGVSNEPTKQEKKESTKKNNEKDIDNDEDDLKKNSQRNKPNTNQRSDASNNKASSTDNANKNLEYNKRMKNKPTDAATNGTNPVKKSNDLVAKNGKKAASGAKNVADKTKDGAKKATRSAGKKLGKAAKSVGNFITTKLIPFIMAHPWILLVLFFIIFFIILIMMIVVFFGKGANNGAGAPFGTGSCKYELSGILSQGTVELSGIKVEIINCDGNETDYTVLQTVNFEKYVLGASLALVGENASDEALKAQIITTRNYVLTRNSAVCPGNQDNCFYGYNPNSKVIRLRACDTDLVYWNYSEDMYYSSSSGKTLYSPEISEGTIYKNALTDERKEEVENVAQQVSGKVLLDSNGDVYKTSKTSTNQFVAEAQNNKSYEEILEKVYGSNNYSSAICSSYGTIDYGDYVIESSNDEIILQESLSSFLESKGTSLEAFNSIIENNVNNAGFGTRAGVVAAAVTLIAELGNNYGVRIPYFWGGGHVANFIQPFADAKWGSGSCSAYDKGGFHYDRCGLDCSGFVPWAIYNGGFDMKEARLAHTFVNIQGAEKVKLDANQAVLQPGDLLESSMHIVLVIGVDEATKEYICAEASGYQYGVWFTRRKFNEKDYYGLRMDNYYNNPSNIRSK